MPRFEVYGDDAEGYRWSLEADDGEVMAVSGEGYPAKSECLDSIMAFADGLGSCETYVGDEGDHRWRFRADDGSVVAVSGGGYFLKLHSQRGFEMVRAEGRDAEIEEE